MFQSTWKLEFECKFAKETTVGILLHHSAKWLFRIGFFQRQYHPSFYQNFTFQILSSKFESHILTVFLVIKIIKSRFCWNIYSSQWTSFQNVFYKYCMSEYSDQFLCKSSPIRQRYVSNPCVRLWNDTHSLF